MGRKVCAERWWLHIYFKAHGLEILVFIAQCLLDFSPEKMSY